MAPSAVLSRFRHNRHGSSSSATPPYGMPSLPPLQTATQDAEEERPSSSAEKGAPSPGLRMPSFSESPPESATSSLTALPSYSDDLYQHRPSSATLERPANAAASSPSTRALNFVFSLQPPKKFAPSLTPNDTPIQSPTAAPLQPYGDRSNLRNVSTSSLPAAEDAVSHKSGTSRLGKAKLNLLNPLSLLARRRSSQNQLPKAEEGSLHLKTSNVPNLPDDYDPRIRGKIVHDFSIPKSRRLDSHPGLSSAETSPSVGSRPSTRGTHRASESVATIGSLASKTSQSPANSPHFKEHFSEDRQALPQTTGYAHTLATSAVTNTPNEPPRLPAFAKSLPLDIFREEDQAYSQTSEATVGSSLPKVQPDVVVELPPNDIPPVSRPPDPVEPLPPTAPSSEKQPSPTTEFLRPGEQLPKHMTSISSRFSFQLGGTDSEAQERLLEEKHKQYVASKLQSANDKEDSETDGSRYTDDEYAGGDELEEMIPGVNADPDGGFAEDRQGPSLHSFQTSLPQDGSATTILNTTDSHTAARHDASQIDAPPGTKILPTLNLLPPALELDPKVLEQVPWFAGLGITSLETPASHAWTGIVQQLPPPRKDPEQELDDMYFDDGDIEGLDEAVDGLSFDEDIFDDEMGQTQNASPQSARNLAPELQQNLTGSSEPAQPSYGTDKGGTDGAKEGPRLSVVTDEDVLNPTLGDIHANDEELPGHGQRNGLTEDNLAYQNALVSAANQAAANGRFSRHLSMSQTSDEPSPKSPTPESRHGPVSDGGRIGRFVHGTDFQDELDDFACDDNLEDDPMIAEANAEVLENDDEGFYGQEFGFYARAHGKGNSEMVNGGFFGPRSVEGVHRSHSAKATFQEPSLTPITERSEWSHRNSIASLHPLGLPQPAPMAASPGIAQLLDCDPSSFDEDMSLSALLKLRRGAWGGSQTSLNSTGASQTGGSPLAQRPVTDSFAPRPADHEDTFQGGAEPSRLSFDSAGTLSDVLEDDRLRPSGNTTETQNTPRTKLSDRGSQLRLADPVMLPQPLSPTSQLPEKTANSHSRASSGAESVSYVKDPEGSGRWLLERRRTGEDGELELVEREYLAGARI